MSKITLEEKNSERDKTLKVRTPEINFSTKLGPLMDYSEHNSQNVLCSVTTQGNLKSWELLYCVIEINVRYQSYLSVD